MKKWKASFGAAAVVIALGLAGCTSPTPESSETSEDFETVSLKVGVLPLVDAAAARIALEEGYFEDQGLDVELTFYPAAAVLVPAIVSGEVDFGMGAVNVIFNALSQDLPLVAVAPGAFSGIGEHDTSGIAVPADSEIESIEDLPGHTVSVVALTSYMDLQVQAAIAEADVDPSTISFQEIPFPDMGAAMDAGRLDAGGVQEPFRTILLNQGFRLISTPQSEFLDDKPLQSQDWFTSRQYASQNPDVVARFQAAINAATDFAGENPAAAREAVKINLPNVDPAVIDEINLPVWSSELDRDSYDRLIDLMTKYVGFTGDVDIDAYLEYVE